MQYKKPGSSVGVMISRCHKWRGRRKQNIDQARITNDPIERERLLQQAEHFGRIVSEEQCRIDGRRDPKEKAEVAQDLASDNGDDDDSLYPDFLANLK